MNRLCAALFCATTLTTALTTALAAAKAPVRIYGDALAIARRELPGGAWDKALPPTPDARASDAEAQAAVNAALAAAVKPSVGQAVLLGADAQEFWSLKSAFSGELEGARFRQTGAWFARKGRRWFVSNVLAGSPAADAGLKRGDEILAVDGKELEPVRSFAGLRPNDKAKITYKRLAWDKPATLALATRVESVQESLLRAMEVSRHLYDFDALKVGYVWLPAATHPGFRRELEKAAEEFAGKADALVLDLRDGFGGADLTYLEPFFDAGKKAIFAKPMVALVDSGTRGGREWLAWLLKRRGRAQLVGSATPGDFAVGKAADVDGFLLYTAVADAKRPAGEGVAPDVAAERPLMYSDGADEPLAVALKTALAAAKR